MSTYPDGNPKTMAGARKVPLHLVPPSATHYLALAFEDGARKYGPYNWREKGVSASVYIAAVMRHLDAYRDGEDVSQDALVHHLGHVMACCAIVLDAASVGMLNDDRPPHGAASRLQATYGVSASRALDMVSMDVPAYEEHPELIPAGMAAIMLRDHVLATDEDEGAPLNPVSQATGD